MLRFIPLLLTLLGLPLGALTQEESKWRAGLGSAEYQDRVETGKVIWAAGEAAMPFLEGLLEDPDPELSRRAEMILQKISLGITPDTPVEVLELIGKWAKGTPGEQVSVIDELAKTKRFQLLLKLMEGEQHPRVERRAGVAMKSFLPKLAGELLEKGELEQVKELLLQAGGYDNYIRYASLLDHVGELEEAIATLRAKTPGEVDPVYLACLRVKGDAALLRKESLRLGDEEAAMVAALALGDHCPFFEREIERKKLSQVERQFLKWSLAESQGHQKEAKKVAETIFRLAKKEKSLAEVRSCLFKMGRGDLVLKEAGEIPRLDLFDYHNNLDRYETVQELLGIVDCANVTDWLAARLEKLKAVLDAPESRVELDDLIYAANFLEMRGHLDSARIVVAGLCDLARGSEVLKFSEILERVIDNAPLATIAAAVREVDEHGMEFEELLRKTASMRFSNGGLKQESAWLFEILARQNQDLGTKDLLLLAHSFSSGTSFVHPEHFRDARDRVLKEIIDGDQAKDGLEKIFKIFQSRNREEDLRLVTEAMEEAHGSPIYFQVTLEIDRGHWQKAADLELKRKQRMILSDPNYSYLAHFRGLVLEKVNQDGAENFLRQAELYGDGSAGQLLQFGRGLVRYSDYERAHELFRHALLRSKDDRILGRILEEISHSAAQLGLWREAQAYREVRTARLKIYSVAVAVNAYRSRMSLLTARGAVASEEGDIVRAVSCFENAHRLSPSDGFLANEFFPLLREMKLSVRHDQLFAESARRGRKQIESYPLDDNLYNNFAWQASRANRALDEAEEYLKRGLELNPESSAYLDTMAEIYFARRNREEAVKWSEQSLENEVIGSSRGHWEIQFQNRRFKFGAFPLP